MKKASEGGVELFSNPLTLGRLPGAQAALCREARLFPMSDLVLGEDKLPRCPWGASTPELQSYHDQEWGRPVGEDDRVFEKLCLEGFQSGLSWLTILRKRDGFRRAFASFDPTVIAGFGDADVDRLLADTGIVRNRAKIRATITNAEATVGLREQGISL